MTPKLKIMKVLILRQYNSWRHEVGERGVLVAVDWVHEVNGDVTQLRVVFTRLEQVLE